MAWIQLIFTSSPQQAEALSDALSAVGAAAVTFQDNADQPIYEPAIGETPLWSATSVIALFDAETDCDAVRETLTAQLGDLPSCRIEAVEDKDWEREWMDNFHPICFGEKLWIVPSWHQPPQPEAVNILLDPGLAFGTGTHPTTALCLQWLDQADLTAVAAVFWPSQPRCSAQTKSLVSIPTHRHWKQHKPMRHVIMSLSKPICHNIARKYKVICYWQIFSPVR